MAELTTQERLQPSLLDRLTDDEPGVKTESRDKRVISTSRLRDYVTRDMEWLLNCVNLRDDEELADYPAVAQSVLNFGIPDLAGVALAGIDGATLQRQLREAIATFEPRLTPQTLQVSIDTERMDQRSLSLRIESEMWAQPIPLNLYLKTDVDLETGRFHVSNGAG